MNTKSKLAIRTILAILFAISLSVVNIESVGADLPPIKCTLEGLPLIELPNWIPNETVTVTANGEKVGEFTTDGNGFGQFTFGQPGVTYDVSIKNASATNSHSLGSVRCEASSGSLNNIVITPSSVNLQVGDSLQISAAGFYQGDSPVSITPTWSATGGTITSGGRYTAGSQTGSFVITASAQGISQSAPVTISAGSLNNIVLTPSSVNLQVGDSLQISAAGFDRSGKSVPITPVWSATGGTITSNGKYTAGSQTGSFTVTASDQSISQSAPVTISPGTLDHIVLTPPSINLQVGGSLQITAAGFDQGGDPVSITPTWSATGGTITSAGVYTAGSQTGSFTVTASDQGISQSVPVQVLPSKTVPAWIYGIGLAIASLLGYAAWYALERGGHAR